VHRIFPTERQNVRTRIKLAATAAFVIAAIGGHAALADATSSKSKAKKHQTNSSGSTSVSSSKPGRRETELTGDAKTKAEAAAQAANPGAKIWRSSTEDPSDPSGAAYEVHLTKSDGSEIEVLEDKDFKVISTQAGKHGRHGGRGGHGGPGGGRGNETELTGDAKTKAEAAAVAANPGTTVERSSTEDPGDSSGAAYEVHLTKSDGSEIEVLEDKDFKVISTEAGHRGRHG
jgi:Fe-S cluster assembly iron-binding protein IscA